MSTIGSTLQPPSGHLAGGASVFGGEEQPAGCLERFGKNVSRALFGLGFIALEEEGAAQRSVTRRFALAQAVDAMQMLAFAFNSSPILPWHGAPATHAVATLLSFITPDSADQTFGMFAFQVLFCLAATWALLFVSLAVMIGYNFLHEHRQSAAALKTFRAVASLSTTVLFLPLSAVLLRAFACDATALNDSSLFATGITCDSPVRFAVLVGLSLLLGCFLVLSLFVTSAFLDSEPGSKNWGARMHGRIDCGVICLKFVLTVIVNTSPASLGSPFYTAFLILSGVLWFASVYRSLHMLHPVGIALAGASAGSFTWSGIALAFAQAASGSDQTGLMLLGTPLAAFAGALATRAEWSRVTSLRLGQCHSLSHILAWSNHKVRAAKRGRVSAGSAIAANTSASGMRNVVVSDNHHATPNTPIALAPLSHASEDVSDVDADWTPVEKSPSQQTVRDQGQTDGALDADVRHVLRELGLAEQGYEAATSLYESAGLAHASASRFYRQFSENGHKESACLAKLKLMNSSPDFLFLVFVRSLQMDGVDSKDGKMNPVDRVMMEQSASEARKSRIEVLREQVSMWSLLGERTPDIWAVLNVGQRLATAVRRLRTQYLSMLRFNPDSVPAIRAFAGFLAELGGDPGRATELRSRADRLDEAHSQRSKRVLRHIVMFQHAELAQGTRRVKGSQAIRQAMADESAAVLTVSMASTARGEIIATSPEACRVLLAPRPSVLIGQNITRAIVPAPFSHLHDMFVSGYNKSVLCKSSIVGTSRVLPVLLQDGTIHPMFVTVDEAPPDPRTLEPRLAAIIEPITTEESFIIFGGKEDGFRVHSASRRSFVLMGVDAATIRDRSVNLSSIMPSLGPDFCPFRIKVSTAGETMMLHSQPSMVKMSRDTSLESRHRGTTEILRVEPMLQLERTGVIPVDTARSGSGPAQLIAGSVQTMSMHGMSVHILRWTSLDAHIPDGVPVDGSTVSATGIEDLVGAAVPGAQNKGVSAWLQAHDADQVTETAVPLSMLREQSRRRMAGSIEECDDESLFEPPNHERISEPGSEAEDVRNDRELLALAFESKSVPCDSPIAVKPRVDTRSAKKSVVFQEPPARVRASPEGGASPIASRRTGSVGDESSVNSAGSQVTTSIIKALTRLNSGKEPSVVRIRRVILFTALLIAAAAVSIAVWMDQSTQELSGIVHGIELSSSRIFGLQHAAMALSRLYLNATGQDWFRPHDPVSDQNAKELSEMAIGTNMMHESSKLLHRMGRSSGESGSWFDVEPVVLIVEPSERESGLNVRSELKTVAAAEAFMFGQLSSISLASAWSTSVDESIRIAGLIAANVHALDEGFVLSMAHRHSDLSHLGPLLTTNLLISGGVFLLLVVCLDVGVFLCAIRTLALRQRQVLELFLMIPREAAQVLRTRALAQLSRAVAEDDGEGVALELGNDATAEVQAQIPQETAPNVEDELQRLALEEDEASEEWEHVLSRIKRRNMRRHSQGAASTLRPHSNSSPFVQRSLGWLMLPVLLIAGWLVVVILMSVSAHEAATAQASRLSRVTDAAVALSTLCHVTTSIVTSTNGSDSPGGLSYLPGGAGLQTRMDLLRGVGNVTKSLEQAMSLLYYGGRSCNALSVCDTLASMTGEQVPEAFTILAQNGCLGIDEQVACETVASGAMRDGVVTAMTRAIGMVRQIVSSAPIEEPTLMTPANEKRINDLLNLRDPFLEHGLETIRSALAQAAIEGYDATESFSVTFTWGFCLFYVLIVTTWYLSSVNELAHPLRSARELAHFIPPELIDAVPMVKNRLRSLATTSSSGSSGGSGQKRSLRCCSKKPSLSVSRVQDVAPLSPFSTHKRGNNSDTSDGILQGSVSPVAEGP